MQTFLTTEATWYFIAKEPEAGIPPRITITSPFRVGRREGFDLCLSCRNVSGLHAELLRENGLLWVEDLNSTNGTFVNGARIRQKTTLKDGDTVQFGQSAFTLVCLGDDNDDAVKIVDDPAQAPESTEERFERLLKTALRHSSSQFTTLLAIQEYELGTKFSAEVACSDSIHQIKCLLSQPIWIKNLS